MDKEKAAKKTAWTNEEWTQFHSVLTQSLGAWSLALTDQQKDQVQHYIQQMLQINGVMNLTAITDPAGVAEKHIADSLSLLTLPLNKAINELINTDQLSVADMGTGAGFPGLPLAIVRPQWHVSLMDSLQKRCRFLTDVKDQLGLANVSVYSGRAEEIGQQEKHRAKYNLVLSRAVARMSVLNEYCLPLLKTGGMFVAFKGPDGESELLEAERSIALLGAKLVAVHTLSLPLSGDQRTMIILQKIKTTPSLYPRKPGIPAKQPL
ncbi:16S rRNA (guanine(527)-N(7))-methyltransferase RsmG [Heliophilum fasciatum]|uniref:Ribosomal RNA small subunit methyltransferase G n=1 Tax=Heliophilum fasciatum TaxID=35700 RepID=A0A4R2RMK3_9FIRM|nr:16S rRNA (guanine(527)-N(7))-methyltransferase RsmG [Heliophilum fasciatum]MCW2278275.1 16S rRNA (guanine527-N7)-methyltransferase [Heliophilum fasciatum]TCP63899.1 16S rRNA m(7)G-527 methyltransferase [Heliophilum fasciatum]